MFYAINAIFSGGTISMVALLVVSYVITTSTKPYRVITNYNW
jgi:hypothetical protein